MKKKFLKLLIAGMVLTTSLLTADIPFIQTIAFAASVDLIPTEVVGCLRGYVEGVDDLENKRTYVYLDESLQDCNEGEYISAKNDEIIIIEVSRNYDSILVEYPLDGGGTKQRWVPTKAIISSDSYVKATADAYCKTYKFKKSNSSFGNVDAGDIIFLFENTGERTRVIYSLTTGGYKIAWANTNELSYTSEETISNNVNFEEAVSEENLVEANVPEGIYSLTSGLSNLQVIDVCDASIESGANVQIWESVQESDAQTFSIVKRNDGWYSIFNAHSGKVLDVRDASRNPGTNIHQWENFGLDNQAFKFYDAGNGFYYIKSKIGNFLDVFGGCKENGTNLQLYSFNGTDSQKFRLNIQMREGLCTISSALNDNAKIDIENASEFNGTNIQLWTGNANIANSFLIWRYKDTSHFFIEKLGTNKELDVEGANVDPEANVQLWDLNYDSNQRWEFLDAGDGYYYIKSVLGDLYLDAYGSASENGTNIQVYPFHGGANQKWRIDFIDYTEIINSRVAENVNADRTKNILKFSNNVREDGKYDIKTKASWINFFTEIPWMTSDGLIKYNNMLICPEQLGNMLYGYYGKECGLSLQTLIFGGEVFSYIFNQTAEDPSDTAYVELGYNHLNE